MGTSYSSLIQISYPNPNGRIIETYTFDVFFPVASDIEMDMKHLIGESLIDNGWRGRNDGDKISAKNCVRLGKKLKKALIKEIKIGNASRTIQEFSEFLSRCTQGIEIW
jgi:hypothetical protein